MKTIKASLRLNKNGRLFCTRHNTYKVSKPPTNGCKICWTIYDKSVVQPWIDKAVEQLQEELRMRAVEKMNEPN